MRSSAAVLLSLFTASALAAPGSSQPCKKAVCNADNCLRAVRASSAKPFPSSATADCSSFMRKTVTPCSATSTATTTVTVTHSPTSVTVTATGTQSQTIINYQTLTSAIATIEDTATIIVPTTVVDVMTSFQPVTVTAAGVNKRVAGLAALPTMPAPPHIKARSIPGSSIRIVGSTTAPTTTAAATTTPATCAATTGAPSNVPTYASACSGTVRYSSACSCAGVTGTTTTLTRGTVTTTSTSTVTYTPTSTVTASVTQTVPVTITDTVIVPTTFETTDASLFIPSIATVTTEVVVPTTVTVSPPVCSSYRFVVTDGNVAGQFITGNQPADSIPYGYVVTGGNPGSAISFDIRPDGTVYSNGQDRWITRSGQLYYILQSADQYANSYNIDNVYCAIGAGDAAYPGAVGTLSCVAGGHAVNFYNCPTTGSDLIQGTAENSAGYGCSPMDVNVIPVAC